MKPKCSAQRSATVIGICSFVMLVAVIFFCTTKDTCTTTPLLPSAENECDSNDDAAGGTQRWPASDGCPTGSAFAEVRDMTIIFPGNNSLRFADGKLCNPDGYTWYKLYEEFCIKVSDDTDDFYVVLLSMDGGGSGVFYSFLLLKDGKVIDEEYIGDRVTPVGLYADGDKIRYEWLDRKSGEAFGEKPTAKKSGCFIIR